jgi:hypothetical protein
VWEIKERYKQKLLAVEMDYWRRSYGKSNLVRVRNEEIHEEMEL